MNFKQEFLGEFQQIGTTTKQMEIAPKNAIFIWDNNHLIYPKHLARKLKRNDLTIVSKSWITEHNLKGKIFSGIILDHSVVLSEEQQNLFSFFCTAALIKISEKESVQINLSVNTEQRLKRIEEKLRLK